MYSLSPNLSHLILFQSVIPYFFPNKFWLKLKFVVQICCVHVLILASRCEGAIVIKRASSPVKSEFIQAHLQWLHDKLYRHLSASSKYLIFSSSVFFFLPVLLFRHVQNNEASESHCSLTQRQRFYAVRLILWLC